MSVRAAPVAVSRMWCAAPDFNGRYNGRLLAVSYQPQVIWAAAAKLVSGAS